MAETTEVEAAELGKAVGGLAAFIAAHIALAERIKAQEALTKKLERQHEVLMAALGVPSTCIASSKPATKE